MERFLGDGITRGDEPCTIRLYTFHKVCRKWREESISGTGTKSVAQMDSESRDAYDEMRGAIGAESTGWLRYLCRACSAPLKVGEVWEHW